MTIWISLPTSVVPTTKNAQKIQEVDAWYQRICSTFDWKNDKSFVQENVRVPIEKDKETEDFASSAIRIALGNIDKARQMPVDMLVDCRSSAAIGGAAPTYKLASKAGLRKILPFSLSGQAGSEVGQAISYLQNTYLSMTGIALISAVQRVVPPDSRSSSEFFPLGDAAAVICAAKAPIHASINFRVLTTLSYQSEKINQKDFDNILSTLKEQRKINLDSICWSISQHSNINNRNFIENSLPKVTCLERKTFKTVDFGCADVLISLQRIFESRPSLLKGTGLLWFLGRFGAIVVVAINSEITNT